MFALQLQWSLSDLCSHSLCSELIFVSPPWLAPPTMSRSTTLSLRQPFVSNDPPLVLPSCLPSVASSSSSSSSMKRKGNRSKVIHLLGMTMARTMTTKKLLLGQGAKSKVDQLLGPDNELHTKVERLLGNSMSSTSTSIKKRGTTRNTNAKRTSNEHQKNQGSNILVQSRCYHGTSGGARSTFSFSQQAAGPNSISIETTCIKKAGGIAWEYSTSAIKNRKRHCQS